MTGLNQQESLQYYFAQWVVPIEGENIQYAYICVENGRITGLGRIEDLPEAVRQQHQQEIEQSANKVISPGLINCHTHLEQSIGHIIPIEPDETFADWLIKVIDVLKEYQSEEERKNLVQKGIDEVLAAGTTCVSDISRNGLSFKLLQSAGLRGISSIEFFHPDNQNLLKSLLDKTIDEYKDLQKGNTGIVSAGLSPHSPYNVSPIAWRYVLEQLPHVFIHTHLAEPSDETFYLQGKASKLSRVHQAVLKQTYQYNDFSGSPVAFMAYHQLLNANMAATHLLEIGANDLKLLEEHRVKAIHCPRSNLNLHGKTLDWSLWRDTNISIGLGTDGQLSTPDLDVRAEARSAMAVHRWTEQEVLAKLTVDGAKVLGVDKATGSLCVGKSADFVLWRIPSSVAGLTPEVQVLNANTRVDETVVAGRIVFECPSKSVKAGC